MCRVATQWTKKLTVFSGVWGANWEWRLLTLPKDVEGDQDLVLSAIRRECQFDLDTLTPMESSTFSVILNTA